MTKTVTTLGCFALLASVIGCQFHARGPEKYRDDTEKVLQQNGAAIEQCYTAALRQDPNLAGQVTVTFIVQPETGKLTNAQVDPARTTAPEVLGQCVVQVLNTIALTPPDEREGQATWVFDFQPRPAAEVTANPT